MITNYKVLIKTTQKSQLAITNDRELQLLWPNTDRQLNLHYNIELPNLAFRHKTKEN